MIVACVAGAIRKCTVSCYVYIRSYVAEVGLCSDNYHVIAFDSKSLAECADFADVNMKTNMCTGLFTISGSGNDCCTVGLNFI